MELGEHPASLPQSLETKSGGYEIDEGDDKTDLVVRVQSSRRVESRYIFFRQNIINISPY